MTQTLLEFSSRIASLLMAVLPTALVVASVGMFWYGLTPDVLDDVLSVPREAVSMPEPEPNAKAAKVGLVEFSDFECSACGTFARDTLPILRKQYVDAGVVRFVFRHHPLNAIHPHARHAAEAAFCAGEQKRFAPFHDRLFDNQRALTDTDLLGYAHYVGLDVEAYGQCMKNSAAAALQVDEAIAATLRLPGTPSFLIGRLTREGKLNVDTAFTGANPVKRFQAALDSSIARTKYPGTHARR